MPNPPATTPPPIAEGISPNGSAPDWEALPDEVHCPLCDYNLRGLVEPRCPECGHRFDWCELTDPTKRLHPYLFEHHPERNIRSFIRTMLAAFVPWRFWSTLLPVQPSRIRRLVFYGLIGLVLVVLAAGLDYTRRAMALRSWTLSQRSGLLTYYTTVAPSMDPQAVQDRIRRYGSIQAYLDATYPLPPSREFFARVWSFNQSTQWNFLRAVPRLSSVEVLAAAAILPWLTALVFQIFQATMRRTRMRPTHLLRVSIYSTSDVMIWLAILIILALAVRLPGPSLLNPALRALIPSETTLYRIAEAAIAIAPIIVIIRLCFAVDRYLRFAHALATALSVQVIVLLVLWKLHFVWNGH